MGPEGLTISFMGCLHMCIRTFAKSLVQHTMHKVAMLRIHDLRSRNHVNPQETHTHTSCPMLDDWLRNGASAADAISLIRLGPHTPLLKIRFRVRSTYVQRFCWCGSVCRCKTNAWLRWLSCKHSEANALIHSRPQLRDLTCCSAKTMHHP